MGIERGMGKGRRGRCMAVCMLMGICSLLRGRGGGGGDIRSYRVRVFRQGDRGWRSGAKKSFSSGLYVDEFSLLAEPVRPEG